MATLDKLCRLCKESSRDYLNVFTDEAVERKTRCKLESYLQIEISIDDSLPKEVCKECCDKLDNFHEFYTSTHETQVFFKNLYENVEAVSAVDGRCDDTLGIIIVKSEEMMEIKTLQLSKDNSNVPSKSRRVIGKRNSNRKVKSARIKREVIESENGQDDEELVDANGKRTSLLKDYPWNCTVCDESGFSNAKALRHHYWEDHGQMPVYNCILCDKQYTLFSSFKCHFKRHKQGKKYKCSVCDKGFPHQTALTSHMSVHSTTRPHKCNVCGKSYKNNSTLQAHSRLHITEDVPGLKKFYCNICGKRFPTKHNLTVHNNVHTGERNFTCDICGKSYTTKGILASHLLIHSDEKNFVCSTCGKAFKTAVHLHHHVFSHTTIKPYQCDACGKQFRRKESLKAHYLIHTETMPHSCEHCGKLFRFGSNLKIHLRQHTGERPYSCLDCNRSFANWSNYNKHMKRIHNQDTKKMTQQAPLEKVVVSQTVETESAETNFEIVKVLEEFEEKTE